MTPFITVLVAFVVTCLLVPPSVWIARRSGILDQPEARKVHSIPISRLGGIAIFLGIFVASACVIAWRSLGELALSQDALAQAAAILTATAFIFAVGLIDDLRTVSSRFKLVALIGASAMVCGSGVVWDEFQFGGQAMLQFRWIGWLITMLWIISVAVAINFIDGLDGLAGGLVLLAASTLSGFLVLSGHVDLAILPLALAGALLGFLCYNWHPARTFMGDGGSMTIGFLLGSTIVAANPAIGTMRSLIVPSLAISIPLLDTLLTVFRRRYQQRRSLFAAEQGHIHHRLLDRGLSHRHTVLVLYAVSVTAVGIGLVSLQFESWGTLGGLSLLVPLWWGVFRLAGSVRTTEMVRALRAKRDSDRITKHYRTTFEQLQLEFHHVSTVAQWWEGVCRAAERLDFVNVHLSLPIGGGRARDMHWEHPSVDLGGESHLHASLPVEVDHANAPSATLSLRIAAPWGLESASERVALFSRLMTEYSLQKVRRKELRCQSTLKKSSSTHAAAIAHPDFGGDPLLANLACGQFSHLRVALVHDFFYTYCGAERVVEQLINVFPHCDVYSLFDFLPESQRDFLRGKSVRTTFIQHLPFARRKHRVYLPLMPLAVEQLDLSGYDLVVSSSYLAAKGVITGPDQLHVCYCHSPVRYAWDLHHQYLDDAGLGYGPRGMLARMILHYIRSWDVRSSMGVDHFIANSQFVARRIRKVYRRKATVIHPPVDTESFQLGEGEREDFYLVVGRMVAYKRTELLVKAFAKMPDRKLIVIGEGPDFEIIRDLATPNVSLLGFQDKEVLVDHMRRAKALLFAAEEDFGIVPVEALACGTPVIAYGKGGVTESVIDGQHGVLYDEQTEASLCEAIDRFEAQDGFGKFDRNDLRNHSQQFSHVEFCRAVTDSVLRWSTSRWPGRQSAADPLPVADTSPISAAPHIPDETINEPENVGRPSTFAQTVHL